MLNDYAGADAQLAQAQSVLGSMQAQQGDYQGLVNLMGSVFTGAAGSENQLFQTRFATAVGEFFSALGRLNGALSGTVASGGLVQNTDNAAAANFQIGV
jgi:hypothetical protein